LAVFPDRKLSFGSGAEATAEAYLFCEMTARGLRFDASEVLGTVLEERMDDREVVQRVRAEQPAFKSWLLELRRDVRSIAGVQCREGRCRTERRKESIEERRGVEEAVN
jgi:hypothetical protein